MFVHCRQGESFRLLVVLSVIFLATSCGGAAPPATTVGPPAWASPPKATAVPAADEHPRLFFDANEIPDLQAKAATSHREIWIPIKDFADSLIGTLPPSSAPPDGNVDFYRRQGNQLIALSFACIITENDSYCDLAKTYLLTYASWQQWGDANWRGLGHAHMLLGNAIAYDWLYNTLTPEERQTVRESLAEWAHRMYEASSQPYQESWNNWWRKSYLQNHYWIANSALGVAGLALLGDEPLSPCTVSASRDANLHAGPGTGYTVVGSLRAGESADVSGQAVGTDGFVWWLLKDGMWVHSDVVDETEGCENLQSTPQMWIDHARTQISIGGGILNEIGDGSWHEGIPYQNYMLTMSLPFMVNLRELQGIDILPHAYLHNYTYWRLYNYLPNGDFILPYGDFEWSWSNGYAPQNLLRFVASEYDDGYAEWTAQQIIESGGRATRDAPWLVFEFLYYDATITPQPPTDLPGAREFPDLEAVIWRTGWGEDDLVFGLKTGAYGGRFAFGTFIRGTYPWEPPCSSTGCQLNMEHDHDDANGFYLFGGGHWLAPENVEYDLYTTASHNTLLIDGQGQYRPPHDHYGQYPEDFINSDGFLEATANSPHFNYVAADATQRYRNIQDLEDFTRHVVFIRPDYLVVLDNLAAGAPHQYEWVAHFGESVSVEGNWIRGNAGGGQVLGVAVVFPQPFQAIVGNDVYPYVHTQPVSSVRDICLIHVLYPTDDASWDARPTATLLDDAGGTAVVRVQMNDGSGRSDDILSACAHTSTTDFGTYYYDGQVAVVTRGADNELRRLFVYGGTFLSERTMGEQALVSNLNGNEPFEATYLGETITVYGNISTEVALYAPQLEQLVVNGTPWPFTRSGDYITFGKGTPAAELP
jgi:hypothetical protein